MIVALVGEKGGTAKTTTTALIGVERALRGKSIALIDGDPQGTLTKRIERRDRAKITPKIPCFPVGHGELMPLLKELTETYDDIIIDVAGRDSEEMRQALGVADVAIFPLSPTIEDLETATSMNELMGEILSVKNFLQKAFFLLVKAHANPFMQATNLNALEFLENYGNIETAPFIICSRASYQRASLEGRGISELKPADNKAAREINELYKTIYND